MTPTAKDVWAALQHCFMLTGLLNHTEHHATLRAFLATFDEREAVIESVRIDVECGADMTTTTENAMLALIEAEKKANAE